MLASCEPRPATDRGAVLAKVHGNYLYEKDLQGVVPHGTSVSDSIFLSKNFIDNWIKNRLLIRQAERNLTPKQLDFSKELDEYRNSLVVFAYESELIKQNLDTLITDTEIEQYYLNNLSNFDLKHNIVRAIYITLPIEAYEIELLRSFMTMRDTIMYDSLSYYAQQAAINYNLNDDAWVRFDHLSAIVPIETFNQELFLRNTNFIIIEDEHVTHLLLIRDYMLSGSLSPLSLVRDNIKSIILNKRKRQLIRQMHNTIFEQAIRDKLFEIY